MIGMLFFHYRHCIALRWFVLAGLLGGVWALQNTVLNEPMCAMAYSYLVFYLAYVPRGWVRHYNRVGDYSYGVYLYAFPFQQALIEWFPDIRFILLFFGAWVLSILAAIISWHVVEARFLEGYRQENRKRRQMLPQSLSSFSVRATPAFKAGE